MIAGSAGGPNGPGDGAGIGAGIGVVAGIVAASVVDATMLSHERVGGQPIDSASAPKSTRTQVERVMPNFAVTPEGLGGSRTTFGLVGTF